ncbi:MAG: DinB family protein [Flavobacteriaceae bacterium]|nr:DinB family protein [Flavobacteriaceae bacterium]
MIRTKWVDRTFNLNIPPGWLPNILSRLDGLSMRLEKITSVLSDEQISLRLNEAWSIKEHIGHLIDLEELHTGRIHDFIERKPILRAADMSNKKTHAANHNTQSIEALHLEFKGKRDHFISSLQALDDETQKFIAVHPRLNVSMRVVDMAFFTAEHDDHHMASIYKILESFK